MPRGYITIDQQLCKGCQICAEYCPKSLISQSDKVNAAGYQPAVFVNADGCTGCALCAIVCPEVAVEVFRE